MSGPRCTARSCWRTGTAPDGSSRSSDGTSGEIDLRRELWGAIFQPLLDLDFFKRATVHPEIHTLVWPNGANFAPEFLHGAVAGASN